MLDFQFGSPPPVAVAVLVADVEPESPWKSSLENINNIYNTRPGPFGRQGLGGSSGRYTSHGYSSCIFLLVGFDTHKQGALKTFENHFSMGWVKSTT